MVKEAINHRQRLLLNVICKYLAVLAILSLNLYHFSFLYFLFYVAIFKNVTPTPSTKTGSSVFDDVI